MPLHLLGKKSWNVYNQDNVSRVRRDEAEAAAREAAEEQAMQEEDSRRRMKVLRGEPVDADERKGTRSRSRSRSPDVNREALGKQELGKDFTYRDLAGKRKRRRGEDDTDRDMRYARRMVDGSSASDKTSSARNTKARSAAEDIPLWDRNGGIQLFPNEDRTSARNTDQKGSQSRDSVRKSDHRDKKDQKNEFDGTMRFSDADRGPRGSESRPWQRPSHGGGGGGGDDEADERSTTRKDVWGNDDPGRLRRENARMMANDPLAAMTKGVQQFRKVEADRKRWKAERSAEIESMKEDERRRARRKSRLRARDDGYGREEEVVDEDRDVDNFDLNIDGDTEDRSTERRDGSSSHRRRSDGQNHNHRNHRNHHRRHTHHIDRRRSRDKTYKKSERRERDH